MALSARAHERSKPNPKYLIWSILADPWLPENPSGYLSLGVAENALMHDVLSEHIHANMSLPTQALTYGDGGKRLKNILSNFLNRHLQPVTPITPSHISHTNGCSSAIEHLSWALGNPGDVFLLGQPYYGTFVGDLTLRMETDLALVPFHGVDPMSMEAVGKYEERIVEAQAQGQRVAGLVIAHPHNPLGRCYPRAVLVELMRLCEKYKIHLISDEIYALSTFPNTVDSDSTITPFESILSIDPVGVIDPALIHIVWGMSKDFGANGIRLGAIISQHNPTLHAAIVPVALYSSSSSISDHVAANVLADESFVEDYIRENQRRLADSYVYVTAWAKEHGIEYAPGVNAAFFLWANLGDVYRKTHPDMREGEDINRVVMDTLLQHKVFLASGVNFGSEQAGWFRVVFSQKREYLDEGLRRILAALSLST